MQCFSLTGQSKTGCNTPDVVSQVPNGGEEITFLDWVATLLLKPPRRLVAALAAMACCWLTVSLSAMTLKAFSVKLLSG